VTVLWRNTAKLQLIVSTDYTVTFYRMVENMGEIWLEQHLIYCNHHQIQDIRLLSDIHLLVQSNYNIVVIAIPLLSSATLEYDYQEGESAIVFVSEQPDCRVLHTTAQSILFYTSAPTPSLLVAKLKNLESELDDLMINKSTYR
jgi:hypothetical protein